MREDNFTNTPEDAAAYERLRGAAEWIDNTPTRAELNEDAFDDEEDAATEPWPDPWGNPPTMPRERLTFTPNPPF